MLEQLIFWLTEQSYLLTAVAGVSVLLLLTSIFAAPWLVSMLPANYLLPSQEPMIRSRALRLLIGFGRNSIALILAVLGLIMLLLPGPGLIMLLLAISLAQVPGKQRLIKQLASRKSVFNTLNWMRKRHHKPPLIHPGT